MVMIKNTREKKMLFFRENFIFFTRLLQKNKKQKKKRQTKLVRFFCRERQKREGQNFFQNSASFFPSSSSHIISITLSFVVSLCHVQKTTNRESFCERCCFLKTQRERKRERSAYISFSSKEKKKRTLE